MLTRLQRCFVFSLWMVVNVGLFFRLFEGTPFVKLKKKWFHGFLNKKKIPTHKPKL